MDVGIMKYFEIIEDKREPWKVKHNLLEIIFMFIAAFAEKKEEWSQRCLVLENGVPTHDTFERCFRIIDPRQFQKCFIAWTEKDGKIVSIDGKTMRGTGDKTGISKYKKICKHTISIDFRTLTRYTVTVYL